jgi:signal transduction histidine kinase
VSEIGDVPAALHEVAPGLAARVAPFLPHVPLLAPLVPPFSESVAEPVQRLTALGFVRAVWLNVEKQVDWLVLVGPKLSGEEYDTFDVSLLRATLDATTLACSRLLLVDALEDRNRQLVAANKRLHQIDDLKTAILAGVNHEMRTPLQRILMYAEALRDESPRQEETRQFLDIILDNTKRLGARIGEALSFAELIGDRRAPQSLQVSLPEVAQAAVERHLESAPPSRSTCRRDRPLRSCPIRSTCA